MTQFWHGITLGLLVGVVFMLLTWWLGSPPPQVPCRCGSAPVESTVILPTMVVRS